jgi:hypothetical protein
MDKKQGNFLSQITLLPAGHPVPLLRLKGMGVSEDLAAYYARSGWLKRLAQGVYARPGVLDLYASLKILEDRIQGCHVGGKSALAWHGIQHFVRVGDPLELYGWKSARVPSWFVEAFPATYRRKRLFDEMPEKPLSISGFGDRMEAPMASEPERAVLEMLSEVGSRQSLSEARSIMEGAYSLREDILIALLQRCTSVKTVRLCLSLSRELGLPFAEALFSADLPKGGKGAWVTKTPEGWLVLK